MATLLGKKEFLQNPDKAPEFDRSMVDKRYAVLAEERDLWVPKWKEIRDFVNPWRGLFESESAKKHYRRDEKIFDGVGYNAVSVLAAGIMFGLTPRSRPWFRLGFEDPELADWEPARYYLDEVSDILYADFARSNASRNLMPSSPGASGAFQMLPTPDSLIAPVPGNSGIWCVEQNSTFGSSQWEERKDWSART